LWTRTDTAQWAHIPEEHQAKAKEYLEFRDRMAAPLEREPAPTEETPESLLLASFTYDANLDAPIQTFPVPADLVATGIDVQSVVVLIKSNWGGEYTCLYRVS
jgi:SUN domain-containing protein 1/2